MRNKPRSLSRLLLNVPPSRLRRMTKDQLIQMLWDVRDHWPPDFIDLLRSGGFSFGAPGPGIATERTREL